MGIVNERERAIRQFVIVKKQIQFLMHLSSY